MTRIAVGPGEAHKIPRFTYLRVVTNPRTSTFNHQVCEGKFLLLTVGEVDGTGDLVFSALPTRGADFKKSHPRQRKEFDRLEGGDDTFVQFLDDQSSYEEVFEIITDHAELVWLGVLEE